MKKNILKLCVVLLLGLLVGLLLAVINHYLREQKMRLWTELSNQEQAQLTQDLIDTITEHHHQFTHDEESRFANVIAYEINGKKTFTAATLLNWHSKSFEMNELEQVLGKDNEYSEYSQIYQLKHDVIKKRLTPEDIKHFNQLIHKYSQGITWDELRVKSPYPIARFEDIKLEERYLIYGIPLITLDMKFALMQVSLRYQRDWGDEIGVSESGAGGTYLFDRKNGKWSIFYQIDAWVD